MEISARQILIGLVILLVILLISLGSNFILNPTGFVGLAVSDVPDEYLYTASFQANLSNQNNIANQESSFALIFDTAIPDVNKVLDANLHLSLDYKVLHEDTEFNEVVCDENETQICQHQTNLCVKEENLQSHLDNNATQGICEAEDIPECSLSLQAKNISNSSCYLETDLDVLSSSSVQLVCSLYEEDFSYSSSLNINFDILSNCDLDYNLTGNLSAIYTDYVKPEPEQEIENTTKEVSYDKVKSDAEYEVVINDSYVENNNLYVLFTIDASKDYNIYIIGDVDYILSDEDISPGQEVQLTVKNWNDDYFEIQVGENTEILAFGKKKS